LYSQTISIKAIVVVHGDIVGFGWVKSSAPYPLKDIYGIGLHLNNSR